MTNHEAVTAEDASETLEVMKGSLIVLIALHSSSYTWSHAESVDGV